MTTRINATTSGLIETVDTSGALELQTAGGTAVIIGTDQNANFATTGAITVPVGTTSQRPTPVNGMMRYNSNVAVFEVYANNTWSAANVTPTPVNSVAPVISGSAIVGQNLTCTTGTWSGSPTSYFYQWNANASPIANATANVFTLTSTQTGANMTCSVIAQNIAGNSSPATSNTLGPVILGTTATYLIVAGGGGGAADGGGGGAGGLQTGTTILQPANTYSITIGAGGAITAGTGIYAGNNGTNTTFSAVSNASVGGGGGGTYLNNGANGGSGGGGAGVGTGFTTYGGTGVAGQGYAGGGNGGFTSSPYPSGGGGGSSQAGANATSTVSGYGGNGTTSTISGSSVTYAGGGGGAGTVQGATAGAGGSGGGGVGGSSGNTGASAPANTGSGGGGGGNNNAYGGGGGSGIVIISYAGAQAFGGGVVSTAGGNTIHTFYTSGSLVPLTALSANYLIVGGGGGGSFNTNTGGGGGAGGTATGSNVTIDSNSIYVVTVGSGGAAASSNQFGANGSAGTVSSFLGSTTGLPTYTSLGGPGTSGNGYAGGTSPAAGSGGGGGASAVGSNGSGNNGGAGGAGITSSISGTSTQYAGGGAGGSDTGTATTSIYGGGTGSSSTTPAINATANTGGGGGGGRSGYFSGSNQAASNGGSGVVIVAYPGSTPQMAGGNVTVVSNTVVHTFTSSGYLTPFVLSNNSLRFRNSASAYLSRTMGTPTNANKMTISLWFKRGSLSFSNCYLLGCYPTSSASDSNTQGLYFNSNDTLGLGGYTTNYRTTNQVFRDPAAWYHLVYSYDSTQSTASNREILYLNGTQITSFSTSNDVSQNTANPINSSGSIVAIGTEGQTLVSGRYFDGEMTEIRMIDGQALTPNAFGTFNQYGVWQPIAYAGSYGTNGFYLPFTNNANTTALGYDFSPQGNNWTTNNFSLTAGSTYDSMTDVPTLTSATAANYAVWNPLTTGGFTQSNGNLTASVTASTGDRNCPTTMFASTGKWYAEVTCTNVGAAGNMELGIVTATSPYTPSIGGSGINGYAYQPNATKGNNGTYVSYGATYANGDVIGIALDMVAGTLVFYKNGASQGTAYTGITGTYGFAIGGTFGGTTRTVQGELNCGQQPFQFSPPSGFVALNTYNL